MLRRLGDFLQERTRAREIALLHRHRTEPEQGERILRLLRDRPRKSLLRGEQLSLAHFEVAEIDPHPGRIAAVRDRASKEGALIVPIEAAQKSSNREENEPEREAQIPSARRLTPPNESRTTARPRKRKALGR